VVVLAQLRDLALHEVERQVVHCELGVLRQRRQCVVARSEAVHQQQRDARAGALTQVKNLAHDHVEEREPVLHLDQRLRARHAHAGAEAAVELQHHGAIEARAARLGERGSVRQVGERLDLRFAQQTLIAVLKQALVVREGLDGYVREALCPHLVRGGAHGGDPRRCGLLRADRPRHAGGPARRDARRSRHGGQRPR
jgi:hypothetical protein